MAKPAHFIASALVSLCTACSSVEKPVTHSTEDALQPLLYRCVIHFDTRNVCETKGIHSELVSKEIADEEIALTHLFVTHHDRSQRLVISDQVSLLQGDKGFQSFQDINFDGHPDIAITTSFGTPNLYLDYWVFDSINLFFVYLGNFPQFQLDKKNRTLYTTVKRNAEHYEKRAYSWEGLKLASEPQNKQ